MGGTELRRAVAASVAVHAAVVGLVALTIRRPTEVPPPPVIDARVSLPELLDEPPKPVLTPNVPVPEPVPVPDPPTPPPSSPAPQSPPFARVVEVPATLPPELLARVRAAATYHDPAVRPVAAVAARPVHGALAAGQRVVYLLDGSGSMGEWGKFDAARNAVTATLALQAPGGRFRVVVYAATAEAVGPAGWADAATVAAALAARGAPAGRGDHLAGLRDALAGGPDFVVWFTDADDLRTDAVRALVRRAGNRVTVLVVKVGANGVGAPAELR